MVPYSAVRLLVAIALLPNANARLFTVVNTCPFTIWHVPAPPSVLSRARCVLTFDGDAGPPWVSPATSTHRLLTQFQIYTDLNVAPNVPIFPTGCAQPYTTPHTHSLLTTSLCLYRWESPPFTSAQFAVPDNWKSGRIWVRIFFLAPRCPSKDASF